MTDAKHSKLPWKWYRNHHCPTKLKGCFIDNSDVRVADVHSIGVNSQEICEANAELIVRSVNSHEKWREAMQEFVDRCDRGEVRSKYTYSKFKTLLADAEVKP